MLFQTHSNTPFMMFLLLTVPVGFVHAAMCFNFENHYKLKKPSRMLPKQESSSAVFFQRMCCGRASFCTAFCPHQRYFRMVRTRILRLINFAILFMLQLVHCSFSLQQKMRQATPLGEVYLIFSLGLFLQQPPFITTLPYSLGETLSASVPAAHRPALRCHWLQPRQRHSHPYCRQ